MKKRRLLNEFKPFLMHAVPVGRIVLGIVWLFHVLYFIFGIKTLKLEDDCA